MSSSPDVPVELLQHIQFLLPPKDAARTCILSKSWLRAWSTIPNLRFSPDGPHLRMLCPWEKETKYKKGIQFLLRLKDAARTYILSKSWLRAWYTIPNLGFIPYEPHLCIHSTLQRYRRDNIPIESFHLQLNTMENQNQEDAKSWIALVTSKSCLKDLSLNIRVLTGELTLPNELFSSQNLSTIHVKDARYDYTTRRLLRICTNPAINCVSLRVMDLERVFITECVFHNLLSTCTLLEKIRLTCCEGLKHVKIKNLLRLRELDILSREEDDFWEIDNVPSLGSFHYCKKFFRETDNVSIFVSYLYCVNFLGWRKTLPCHMDSLQSVTQLHIGGVIIDNSFFDILNTNFPLLESLTLAIGHWEHENMVISSDSLRWLTLDVSHHGPVNAKVNAQRLLSFTYTGNIPRLMFPTIVPEQIKLTYNWMGVIDNTFFFKMMETLNLSSKFEINIKHDFLDSVVPLDIDVDDLRSMVLYPVTDVQLSLETLLDERVWEQSRFFDAFFLICHPSYIRSSKLVIGKMMEWNKTNVIDVQLKNLDNGKWEALTSSWKSVLHDIILFGDLECKLNWFPQ